jgi:hypothetical protein
MSVHTKVLPLCSLTALKPTSEFGQVRPGAAVPCGYPSSGFAALPGARDKRVSEETKVKERSVFRLELMEKAQRHLM